MNDPQGKTPMNQEPPPEKAPEAVGEVDAPDLDLAVERIDTRGTMKEGFTGQEM